MNYHGLNTIIATVTVSLMILQGCSTQDQDLGKWETITANGSPTARHEAGLVAYQDKIYLIGGRRINPTDEYDTRTNTWTAKSPTPIELHHFQPVVIGNAIYLMGAMTGKWPEEKPLDRIVIYYPEEDKYSYGDEIPINRRRGGAGVVYHNNKIYVIGGITNGHMKGFQPWLDEYDPESGTWRALPDAPNSRDHFQAAVIDNKLYAFAGRASSRATGEDMKRTIQHGNVFDFATEKWEPVTSNLAIPTMRAGNAAFALHNEIIIGGGESMLQDTAHSEVEAFNVQSGTWRKWPSLVRGRHGSGFAVVDDYVYIASGSGNRGGGPELTSIERLKLPASSVTNEPAEDQVPVFSQWHTITLSFEGPETSETAADNPFLNYFLNVEFKHADGQHTVRGFYAADGNASETSADGGNKWQVRFTPDRIGDWSYSANMYHGDSVALTKNTGMATAVDISNSSGQFMVTRTDKSGPDFRAFGGIEVSNGYFRFKGNGDYWLKGGADSPENLLAYDGFDGTYRMQTSSEDGEASTDEKIHAYTPHLHDWNDGDPSWQDGRGKSLIGAINYLSSKGMNVVYFLTNNILGDGKDVWPYITPEDFTRFDVSKLDQWEIVFKHMQAKGIMLHMVLQETENETMLDKGDTGPMRQLYLQELIARFGHHLALKWNLGEENGPAVFTPNAQNDEQRKAMANYIKQQDPYGHPVLLHTHSHEPARSNVLNQIVGFKNLDGLSLQVDKREGAPEIVRTWKQNSLNAGHPWLITMDEIGMWHTGAVSDSLDPNHDTLRRYVLWGTLLSGAAGVEWYFGANNRYHDLNTEDWRSRDRLWEITHHAIVFFEDHLPYWEMQPGQELINSNNGYCFTQAGEVYAVYLPRSGKHTLDLRDTQGTFNISWYNPLTGGALQIGSTQTANGGGIVRLGSPPVSPTGQDWVVLVKRTE